MHNLIIMSTHRRAYVWIHRQPRVTHTAAASTSQEALLCQHKTWPKHATLPCKWERPVDIFAGQRLHRVKDAHTDATG